MSWMIRWLTWAIIRERMVVNTIPRAMIPTKRSAIRPIMAVSLFGTASSSTHWVILGIKREATLAMALSSSAASILYLCRAMYLPARFRCCQRNGDSRRSSTSNLFRAIPYTPIPAAVAPAILVLPAAAD